MRISIRHKVFLILLFSIGLVVVGMTLFMTWSLEKGFVRFVEARQEFRIEEIAKRLTTEYIDAGGWQHLEENDLRWAQLLIGNAEELPKHRPAGSVPQSAGNPGTRGLYAPISFTVDGTSHSYLPLERRVMLLDTDKSIIFGLPELADRLTLRPITVDDHLVGYLGVIPGMTVLHLSGTHYLDKQTDAFVLIALAVLLVSAVLAFFFAGRMMRPVQAFAEASRALATGHYDTRIPVTSRDELGQLAENFNSLAQALEKNETSRRQWVADISHELRTPLAVLRGEIEALQDGIRPLDLKAVHSLHGEALHLSRLVDDLYELSMSDVGSLKYRKTMVNPVLILQDALDAYEAEFRARGIKVTLEDRTAEGTVINADPDRLAQLFDNLFSNSLRYTDAGGSLIVKVDSNRQELLFDFMDSAPGVPDEDLPHLFERFFRADASRNRVHGGAGLGLAICRNIVQAHDGTITAFNSELGGVWVRITLPL